MKVKKKPLYTLLSLLIVLALAVPVWSTVVRADDAIQIHDWQDLYNIRLDMGGSYVLMNDLDSTTDGYDDLAGPAANAGQGWQPIGDSDSPFAGILDGQNYEIRDLYVNRPDEDYVGLFGHVGPAGAIENVGVVDANVTGKQFVGGLAGRKWGPVSNSHATGSMAGTEYVGGLVGHNSNGDVSNSYSKAGITGDDYVGGLMGWNSVGTVSNSYATGSVIGDYYAGGLVGENAGTVSRSYATGSVSAAVHRAGGLVGVNYLGTVTDSYASGSVSGSSMVGGLVGDNSQGWVSYSYSTGSVSGGDMVGGLVGENYEGSVTNCFWDTETSGTDYSDGGVGRTTSQMKSFATFNGADWDIAAVLFGNVSDTHIWSIVDGQTYPFLKWEPPGQIRDWHNLHAVRGNLSGSYALMNDLDSTTAGYDDLAGPTANGGMGWQPIGTWSPSWAPFTGSFDGHDFEIRDLVIDRPGEDYVGLFGFVGSAGTVGDLGLVSAYVTGNNRVGGLVGDNAGTVSNSYSTVDVTGDQNNVGGLVGYNSGTVTTSHSGGSVIGNESVGGLVGTNTGTVSHSHSAGSVNGAGLYAGGLVGQNLGNVSHSHSSASVTGSNRVGGLVGQSYGAGTMTHCYSSGGVFATDHAGGLVGYNDGPVSTSHSSSSVTGNNNVGGLVGYNAGPVSTSHSSGSVIGYDFVGGLVGLNWSTVSNCHSGSSVTGNDCVGGLVGGNQNTVNNSHSSGSVTGHSNVGGLVGQNNGTINNSFWDTETSGTDQSAGGTPKTTADMKNIATFTGAGWEIIAVASGETNPAFIWNIIHGRTYPFLSWQGPVEVTGALIEGQTRQVNCDILDGVAVTASLNEDEVDTASDGDGNYSLLVPVTGLYQVVATKAGFRPQTRWIDIENVEEEYTLHFHGDHGLVPNAPDVFYVLECVNLWLYADEPCAITVFKVLEVVNAWLYEIEG